VRVSALVLASVALASLVACPTPANSPTPAATPTPTPPVADEWRCGGDLVPPSGWQQETAFADATTPNARDEAANAATAKLTRRLCATAGGAACDSLAAHARLWKTGTNGKDVCAMAVIKAEELAEWRALSSTLTALDDRLGAAAGELLRGVAPSRRVAIDAVVDLGIPGGPRADWLRARMERFVGQRATLVDVPKRWAGDGVPDGVDVLLRASLVSRLEQGVATVESTWSARFRDGHKVASAPVAFPEQAAPRAPAQAAPPLAESSGLSARLDSDHGGGLCPREQTRLWVKSDTDAIVRVFDLYGAGEALLSHPTSGRPDAHLRAGQPISLAFEATPMPGSESERFLVLAAPSERALGRFASTKGECRVPADLARGLASGEAIPPGVKVATTGYRIVTGGSCPATSGPSMAVAEAVAALPLCPL